MDVERPARVTRAFEDFFAGATVTLTPEWPAELFADVVANVPAYGKFLRERGIDPASITSDADFRKLPLLDKGSYHRRYPLPELCRDGRLDGCDMIAVSSGSSGSTTI